MKCRASDIYGRALWPHSAPDRFNRYNDIQTAYYPCYSYYRRTASVRSAYRIVYESGHFFYNSSDISHKLLQSQFCFRFNGYGQACVRKDTKLCFIISPKKPQFTSSLAPISCPIFSNSRAVSLVVEVDSSTRTGQQSSYGRPTNDCGL